MPVLRPEELYRLYPARDFLVAEGDASSPYMIALHRSFYRFAAERTGGCEAVLDAGCGTGLGTDLLAERSELVVGVDVKAPVLAYADHRSAAEPRPRYAAMDAGSLGFPSAVFDAVVVNELLEHLPDHRPFLDEAVRVLRPGGLLVCATVNGAHTFGAGEDPLNRNHFREFDAAGFRRELAGWFDRVEVLGQEPGEAFDGFRRHPVARGVERFLLELGIKHRIPPRLRMRVRSWITGTAEAEIADEGRFPITDTEIEDSVYLVGIGRRPQA